jgi:hypothetical protein
MSTRIRLTVFILLLTLTACAARDTMEKNQQKWASQNAAHYRFNLTIGCFCPWRDLMPLKVEVKDGQVISLTDKTGQSIPANFADKFNKSATMEGLYKILDSALEKADEVRVVYNDTYGYPKSIHIDYVKNATDDEIEYTVENFEVLK